MADGVKNDMPDELSGKMKVIELCLSSTRFKVVLAAIIAIYMIVVLVVEAETVSDGVLNVALWGCRLITGLAAVHIVLRTCWKAKNGAEPKSKDTGTDLPGD